MGKSVFPFNRCEAAKKITEALANAGYRIGWQLSTDPRSEYRPHYRLTGYVGPGGVLLVQDFYDPGDATTRGVEVYSPITVSMSTDATIEAIKTYGRSPERTAGADMPHSDYVASHGIKCEPNCTLCRAEKLGGAR